MMRKVLSLIIVLLAAISVFAQAHLSEDAEISILTSSPTDDAVFTVYGHTAIRVKDTVKEIDIVFNYGIFDFTKSNFIYRFAKGETDYKLAAINFEYYLIDYMMRGSSIIEQVLNLTGEEKDRIFNALIINSLPANAVYRYNFFYDNCSTRPRDIIENNVDGTVLYAPVTGEPQTFRDLINHCTRNQPWQTFGCDIAVGSPADRPITQREEMFLPDFLMNAFAKATISSTDGTSRPLVSDTHTILEESIDEMDESSTVFTPLVCCWLLFFLIVLSTWVEWRKRKYFRWLEVVLFFITGLAGSVLFFLVFISEHPCMHPNWLIIWLHPFHLAGAVLFAIKKYAKAAYCYHFINFAALTLMLAGWYLIPQHLNPAFLPLVGILWMRSGFGVYRHKFISREA